MRAQYLLYAIPLVLLAASANAHCGQKKGPTNFEMHMGYNVGLPLGDMGSHTGTAHSISLRGLYLIPTTNRRLAAGAEVIMGSYASFTKTQMFGMNGVQTPTDVNYNSNITNATGVARYDILRANNITAFAGVKGGMAKYTSRLSVEDPEDPDGCEVLDEKTLINDYTWIAGVQTGANIDFKAFFKKMPEQTLLLQVYAGYVHGGNVDYINVKNTTTDNQSGHTHGSTTNPDGSRPLDVRFVNLQTNAMHTHEVARVYTSPVQFMECGISLVVPF